MTLRIADRVQESSTTTGTGAFTLAGAYTGYIRFSAVPSIVNGDTLYYCIEAIDSNGNPSGDWETGLGTYSGANTLTRTTPAASSNAGAAVNFAAGNKRVSLDATAGLLALYAQKANNLSDMTAATVRTNLSLVPGTDIQAYDADLADIAGLADAQGDVIVRGAAGWERLAAGTSGYFLKTQGSGATAAWAGAAYRLSAATSTVGTDANTSEKTLQSYAMSAAQIGVDGAVAHIVTNGALAATTRSRTIRLKLGSTTLASVATTANTEVNWSIEAWVTRRSSTSQQVYYSLRLGTAAATDSFVTTRSSTGAEDLATALTIALTGQVAGSPVANDIDCRTFIVEYLA